MADSLDPSIAMATLNQLPLAVVIVEDQRIIWTNQKFREISGYDDTQLLGISLRQCEDEYLSKLFNNDGTTLSVEMSGQQQFSPESFSLLDNKEAYVFKDVTQQCQYEEQVKQLKPKDSATGLYNKRIILENLASQVTRSRRYGNPLALLRLSISGCEPVDTVIRMKAVAEQLKDRLRWADCLGTLDENSILIILPETCLEEARELAAKLLNDRAIASDGCSIQFGITAWQKGDDPTRMLANVEENQDVSTMALLS
jgi:GGDEF domain-containing protein